MSRSEDDYVELMAIRDANDRQLTAEAVVTAATPRTHYFHDRFEWDNKVAGHAHRVDQARQLIRVVRTKFVRPNGEPGRVRAFHSIPTDGIPARTYEPTDEIIESPITTALLLREMERDWATLKARWAHFAEFIEMVRRDMDAA